MHVCKYIHVYTYIHTYIYIYHNLPKSSFVVSMFICFDLSTATGGSGLALLPREVSAFPILFDVKYPKSR